MLNTFLNNDISSLYYKALSTHLGEVKVKVMFSVKIVRLMLPVGRMAHNKLRGVINVVNKHDVF